MIPVADEMKRQGRQGAVGTGYFRSSGTAVFFAPSRDGTKLFMLRKSLKTGVSTLLAVLLKSVTITPRLGGLEGILNEGGMTLERSLGHAGARQG